MFETLTQEEFEEAEKKAKWKGDFEPILQAQIKKIYKEFIDWVEKHRHHFSDSDNFYYISPDELNELKKKLEELK